MPHNHPPRCCCEPTYNGAIVTSAKPCPSCIEHGELAMLGDNTNRSAQNPAINAPHITTRGEFISQMVTAAAAAQSAECPSCHTTDGHPHTDYCQAPNSQRARAGYAEQPRCQTVDIDGEPVRVQGSGGHISPAAGEAIAAVVRATRDAMAQTDTVDLVGHLRASVERAREARLAQAQTSQPAATTSQPPTQLRGLERIPSHLMAPPHDATPDCTPLCNATPPRELPPSNDHPR